MMQRSGSIIPLRIDPQSGQAGGGRRQPEAAFSGLRAVRRYLMARGQGFQRRKAAPVNSGGWNVAVPVVRPSLIRAGDFLPVDHPSPNFRFSA